MKKCCTIRLMSVPVLVGLLVLVVSISLVGCSNKLKQSNVPEVSDESSQDAKDRVNEIIKKENEILDKTTEEDKQSSEVVTDSPTQEYPSIEFKETELDLSVEYSDTSSVEDFVSSIDYTMLDYSYIDAPSYQTIFGVGADLEKVRGVIDLDAEYSLCFKDLVVVAHPNDFTTVYKFNPTSNDILIVRNVGDERDDIIQNTEIGAITGASCVIQNMSIQEVNSKEVVVYTYARYK